jgi:hypothetical protein
MAIGGVVHAIPGSGYVSTLVAVAATETVIPVDDLTLHIHNGSGVSTAITIQDGGSTPGGTLGSGTVVNVAASADTFIAVPSQFAAPATGLVTVTISPITTITGEWLTR